MASEKLRSIGGWFQMLTCHRNEDPVTLEGVSHSDTEGALSPSESDGTEANEGEASEDGSSSSNNNGGEE